MRIEGVSRLEKAYLWVATRVPFLRKLTTRVIVNRYARAAPPRPRPYSMATDGYTSWTGLSDPTYTGRHLPPRAPSARKEPSVEEVVELFLRRPGEPCVTARDTSLLFPFFAQWFTDSFLRTDPVDYRKNQSNHGIDLLQIYGASEAQTKLLRAEGGFLDSQRIDGEEYAVNLFEDGPDGRPQLRERFRTLFTPENFDRVFVSNPKITDEQRRRALAVGLEHGNSTLGNVLMNTVFLREHNRLVRLLRDRYDWDDDRLFETARNINIVMVLKVVIEDYVPHISRVHIPLQALPGVWDREPWYRTNRMAVEFNLLYRWHGLIPDTFTLGGTTHDSSEMVNANHLLFEHGVEGIVRSVSKQNSGCIGLGHTPLFLRHVKTATVNLGRQAKLQPYNAYRKHFGLCPFHSFDALTRDRQLADKLEQMYGSIDEVEYLVGLAAEHQNPEDMMGELQLVMVAHDAFTHALTNPLLSKRVFNKATFSVEGLNEIERTRGLADLIARNCKGLHASEASFFHKAH